MISPQKPSSSSNLRLTTIPSGGLALVFGATGGIGQALAMELGDDAGFVSVINCSRSGEFAFDLTSEESISALAEKVKLYGTDIRLVIDATGVLGDEGCIAEKTWRQLDPSAMARAFAINAIGPALVMKHFLPLLPRAGKCVFATLSAHVGSIGDNQLGGWYSYRASKAALNQLMRSAAIELHRSSPEAICVAVHPGMVNTRLAKYYARTGVEIQPPELAAVRILSMIDKLTPEDSGQFMDYRGQRVPW
ncbi:SDR family oxidoreductase [Undibacterium terreum]|uniref:SDR family oxidoreductase n=1 Tax=Undibacterium terreum TaxID=1224302 RepID=A0A916XDE0_9BURK|nr:SDR family oxidoreductase [Undibacterium terreum]GGC65686.1 SDR family oxidoreductase [Undibacterium terreum]